VPEGDTIHKIADYLAPRLQGRAVRRLRMADAAGADRCTGRRIEAVFAHGKHLFMEFDNDLLLRSHLGMYGDWHRYRAGEAWRRPRWQASLELATDADVFVCFNAKEVELMRAPSVRERILGARLGPDLVHADVDPGHIVQRAREFLAGETLLADVLLDQRVAAGIGNVYKSEVLFIEGRLPRTPLEAVGDAELARYFSTAADLLRRNLGGGPRVTRFANDHAGRLWVYGRRDKPCLRCAGRITSARLGRDHRSTYWCRQCQS
jgi:endonuclease-8